MLHRVTQLVYSCAATLLLPSAVLAYKKYSRLSSSVEVGKGSSKFLSTIGCMTPKLPICCGFWSASWRKTAAAWPGR